MRREHNYEFNRLGQPIPRVVRPDTWTRMYTRTESEPPRGSGGIKFYDLSQGVAPQEDKDPQYPRISVEPARQHVRNRWAFDIRCPTPPHVSFFDGGSYFGLDQIFSKLVYAPNQRTVRVLDTGLDFPAAYKYTRRYYTSSPRRDRMPYEVVSMPLRATLSETIERVIEVRSNDPRQNFIVYVCNPNSPKGDSANIDLIHHLADVTAYKGDLLVVDEAFGDALPDDQSAITLTQEYYNMIVTRSLSKVIGFPELRIGYAVMSEGIGDPFEGTRNEFDMKTSSIEFVNDILNPTSLLPHLEKVRARIKLIKDRFVDELRRAGIYIFPTDNRTPILFVDGRREDFCKRLGDFQVAVASGGGFSGTSRFIQESGSLKTATSQPEPLTNRYARVTIPKNMEDIPEIVHRFRYASFNK